MRVARVWNGDDVDDGGEATTMGPRLGAQIETRDLGSMDAKVAAVTGEASARLLVKTLETNAAVGRLQDALLSDLEASSEVLERVAERFVAGRGGGGGRGGGSPPGPSVRPYERHS